MIIQHVLRGMSGLDRARIEAILTTEGLRSRWFRDNSGTDPAEWAELVDADRLHHHLARIARPYPPSSIPYGDESPFISLTAGTVVPQPADAVNVLHDAWLTAAIFATDGGDDVGGDYVDGWIVAGYVTLAGRPSTPHLDYCEEVRDLNQHHRFVPFHHEGEIVAKIYVPPLRLAWARRVTGADMRAWRDAWAEAGPDPEEPPTAIFTPEWFAHPDDQDDLVVNPRHVPAESLGNVRAVL